MGQQKQFNYILITNISYHTFITIEVQMYGCDGMWDLLTLNNISHT